MAHLQTQDATPAVRARSSRRVQPRGQETRQRLLVAARELFGRKGYEGTSIGDVAEQAGIGVGTVYHHFEDKRSLLLELLERYEGGRLATSTKAGRGFSDAFRIKGDRSGFVGMLRVFVAQRRIHPSLYGIARELARRDPQIAACTSRIEQAHRDRIRMGIGAGQQEGVFRKDIDPYAAAFVLQPLMQSGVTQIAEAEADSEPQIQALADLVCSYLLAD